jgi:predicted permease
MSPMMETVLFVFGLVALGYLAGWAGVLRPQVGDALADFAISVAVPALLFRTMIEMDFAGSAPWAMWLAYFAAVPVVWLGGHLAATRLFRRDAAVGVVAGIAASFSNVLLLGLPFMQGVYGRPGVEVLSLLLAVHLPIMMAASIVMFEWACCATSCATCSPTR